MSISLETLYDLALYIPDQEPIRYTTQAPPPADEIAVFDANFQQLFVGARPTKATVKEVAKLMEHPIEDGATIADHRIILPIEIEFSVVVNSENYVDTYNQIRSVFFGVNLNTVQTKTGRYGNMMIEQMPHEESPDTFDTITIALTFKQVFIVKAQYGKLPPAAVKEKKDASTVDKGQQDKKEPKKSLLINAGDKLDSFFGVKK